MGQESSRTSGLAAIVGDVPPQIRVITSATELLQLSEPWEALADAAGARHYSQPLWCLPWWHHLGQGELHVVVAESDGQLLALAPLYRCRSLGLETIRFLGSAMLGVSEVLVAPGHQEAGDELWDSLLDLNGSVLELHNHRQAGLGFNSMRRQLDRGVHAYVGHASPILRVDGSWDDYWAGRKGNFRRTLERRLRLAEREGLEPRVEVATTREDVDEHLADMTAVFEVSERANPKMNFLAGRYRPFTIEILRQAADRSRLALFVLYFGKSPAAVIFTIRTGSVVSGAGLRFDPSFGRFSPGTLVVRAECQHAFDTGCSELDMGPGDVPYKRDWCTDTYDTVDVTAYSSRSVHGYHAAINSLVSSSRIQALLNDSFLRRNKTT